MSQMSQRAQALRVLVIDDEPMVAKTLAAMVRRCGATHTVQAHDGNEALRQIAAEEFDVVLCDLNMPTADGIETMRVLADNGVTVAVILLSGSDPKLLRAARDLGINRGLNIVDALSKPAQLSELRHAMKHLKRRTAHRRPRRSSCCFSTDELNTAICTGQLRLHFQPQVHMRTGALDGAEVLLRWEHPSLGLILPDAFIPVAEASGLIEPMTTWVVQRAIEQGAAFRAAGYALPMSVNVSAKTLEQLDLPDRLERAIRHANLAPEDLTLEMTESGVVEDLEAVLDITTRLRIKRFPLSMDDFGTGASSLAQLRRLPFSELKIDRMFVRGASQDEDSRAMLTSTVELAKRLHLKVVAEGIETQKEWDIVAKLGVDLAQGYYVARPMTAPQLLHFRDRWAGKTAV